MTKTSVFLRAEWRDLIMLNYEVDPAILKPHVPAGTELDVWQGKTMVSMVGFKFLKTRVLGLAIPFHINFDEVNLRFYVRYEHGGEQRRGAVFIKEIVPRPAIAWVANSLYNENYVALPMRHDDRLKREQRLSYAWRFQGQWQHLGVELEPERVLPTASSEEAFISEHYWGYSTQRDGTTMEYQVEHPQWQVQRARESFFECDVASLYGPEFAPYLKKPRSAFLAVGSEVIVRRGLKLSR